MKNLLDMSDSDNDEEKNDKKLRKLTKKLE